MNKAIRNNIKFDKNRPVTGTCRILNIKVMLQECYKNDEKNQYKAIDSFSIKGQGLF